MRKYYVPLFLQLIGIRMSIEDNANFYKKYLEWIFSLYMLYSSESNYPQNAYTLNVKKL